MSDDIFGSLKFQSDIQILKTMFIETFCGIVVDFAQSWKVYSQGLSVAYAQSWTVYSQGLSVAQHRK